MQVLNYHLRRYNKPDHKDIEVLTILLETDLDEEERKNILQLLEEATV